MPKWVIQNLSHFAKNRASKFQKRSEVFGDFWRFPIARNGEKNSFKNRHIYTGFEWVAKNIEGMIQVFFITTKILTKDGDADLSSNLLMERSRRVRENKSVREEEEEEEDEEEEAQIRL